MLSEPLTPQGCRELQTGTMSVKAVKNPPRARAKEGNFECSTGISHETSRSSDKLKLPLTLTITLALKKFTLFWTQLLYVLPAAFIANYPHNNVLN